MNEYILKIKNQYYFKKTIFSFVKSKIIVNKALFSIYQADPWKKFLLLKNYLSAN